MFSLCKHDVDVTVFACVSHGERGGALNQGHGLVALVSAGSRGIRAAVVRRLAADGRDIAFCYPGDAHAARKAGKAVSEPGPRRLATHAEPADTARGTSVLR